MKILLDTNIIVRLADKSSSQHPVAKGAVLALERDLHELYLVPQNLYEYWVVATRPVADNGLGIGPADADEDLEDWANVFRLLLDERGVFRNWRGLVRQNGVIGKRAHDARLVAAMNRHGLSHILTFNTQHFKQFASIQILDPTEVAAT